MKYASIIALLMAIGIFACGPKKGTDSSNSNDTTNTELKEDSTLQALNKRIADDPNNFQNYLDRAKYFGALQKYDLAMKDIARALTADSTQGSIYLFKGKMLFDQQKVKEAYDEYANCLRFESNNTDCLVRKAELDIALDNFELALNHLNEALKLNDQIAEAYYLKGRLYKKAGDTTLSKSSYQTAIEVDPNYYDAYIEVGLLYAAQKHKLAKEYYNSAIEVRPRDIQGWYNKAMYLQETGNTQANNYTEAFACYDTILKIDPAFSAAEFNKGYIHLVYQKQYQAAIDDFTRAIKLFPNYFQAYYNRGLAYEKLGKKKEAETDYRSSLSIQPQYDDAAKALTRVLGERQ